MQQHHQSAGRNIMGPTERDLVTTYKAIGRSVINYATPIWAPNTSKTGMDKRQISQNSALHTATGCHRMSPVDHLPQETKVLPVATHSELLAAQYLAKCGEPNHPCHYINTRPLPPRAMKETLQSKYRQIVERQPVTGKTVMKTLHTEIVARTISSYQPNVILGGRPPPVNAVEVQFTS